MFFDNEEVSGRRLTSRRKRRFRKTPVLRVNARLGGKGKAHRIPTATLVLVPVVILVLAAVVWLGASLLVQVLFSKNKRFEIARLNIEAGKVITPQLIREYTQIKEGMNLFEVDVGSIQKEFLRRAPNVRAMRVSRRLPDTLEISVTEREPLARIGRRGHLVVDGDGYVFGLGGTRRELPVISGVTGIRLKPGARLSGMSIAGIQILELCQTPTLGLVVDYMEVDKDEYVLINVPRGQQSVEVKLSWRGMGKLSRGSYERLLDKLNWIRKTLASPQGQRLSKLDATFNEKIVAE